MNMEELLNKAKPILFNTEMVKAILEERKTVTRRVLKLPSHIKQNENGLYTLFAEGTCYENQSMEEIKEYIKPPYAAGDYLYVRETWNISNMCADGNKVTFIYRGDKSEEDSARTISVSDDAFDKYDEMMYEYMPEWRPSIHMPKEAARIFLKVTDVRVERLQDITDVEAEKEGVTPSNPFVFPPDKFPNKENFKIIWNSTIKKADLDKYGWDANPWVWVIEFERVEV